MTTGLYLLLGLGVLLTLAGGVGLYFEHVGKIRLENDEEDFE
jgi:hypothetical protein